MAGLTGFLRTLAREIAADGVTVNSLLPGLHATERITSLYGSSGDPAAGIPSGAIGDPADFGRVGAFLCSEHAALCHRHRDPGRRRFVRGSAVIRHVSLLTFVAGATDAHVDAIAHALSALPSVIPELRGYAVGRDLGIGEGNASFAVVADCETVDDYIVYRDHPEHRRILTELIAPVLAARTAAQYEVG